MERYKQIITSAVDGRPYDWTGEIGATVTAAARRWDGYDEPRVKQLIVNYSYELVSALFMGYTDGSFGFEKFLWHVLGSRATARRR